MKDKKLLAFIIPFFFCIAILAYAYRGYSAEQEAAGASSADYKRLQLADYHPGTTLINPAQSTSSPTELVYEGSSLLFENPMAANAGETLLAGLVYEGSSLLFENPMAASGDPIMMKLVYQGSAQLNLVNLSASLAGESILGQLRYEGSSQLYFANRLAALHTYK